VWLKVNTTIKSHVLLSMAMLRELYNKIAYYKSIIDKNISRYIEYKEKISNIAPEKLHDIDIEIDTLKTVNNHLNNVSIFLEKIILRLETLVAAGNNVAAALIIKDIVKELRHHIKGAPPILVILVDKLDEVSRALVQDLKLHYDVKNVEAISSSEVSKILSETKKVANLD